MSLTCDLALLPFSPRVQGALRRSGARTLGHLLRRNAKDLVLLPGFGKGMLREVRQVLAAHGCYLAGENPSRAESEERDAWEALQEAQRVYATARENLHRNRRGGR